MAKIFLFNASSVYNNSRNHYKTRFYDEIKDAENKIMNDPKHAGRYFAGNKWKRYRHININSDIRLWYVICEERRALFNSKFQKALRRNEQNIQICEFCNLPCIKIPENTVMLLKIMDHNEQDRLTL